MLAQAPTGAEIHVIIPPGKSPGDVLTVEYDAPEAPMYMPQAQQVPSSAYPQPDYASDGVRAPQAVHQYPQVILNPANQVQGPPGSTLIYDGHGGASCADFLRD